jgi:hypothetical protein
MAAGSWHRPTSRGRAGRTACRSAPRAAATAAIASWHIDAVRMRCECVTNEGWPRCLQLVVAAVDDEAEAGGQEPEAAYLQVPGTVAGTPPPSAIPVVARR